MGVGARIGVVTVEGAASEVEEASGVAVSEDEEDGKGGIWGICIRGFSDGAGLGLNTLVHHACLLLISKRL